MRRPTWHVRTCERPLDASQLIVGQPRELILDEELRDVALAELLAQFQEGAISDLLAERHAGAQVSLLRRRRDLEEVEVEGYLGTYTKPVYGAVPIPPEVDEYCRAFGDGTVEEREDPEDHQQEKRNLPGEGDPGATEPPPVHPAGPGWHLYRGEF